MKLIIDCTNLQVGGGIQVALSFINDLIKINSQEEFYILMSPQISSSLKKMQINDNFQLIEIPQHLYRNIYLKGLEIKKIEDKIIPNVIFTVFGPSYHKSNYPKIVGFAIGHMLYPDSPYFKTINFISRAKIKIVLKLKKFFFVKNSDALVFETDDSNRIFSTIIKRKIKSYTVSNTLNEIFYHPEKWTNKEYYIEKTFNILCLTANYPHKNLTIIPSIIDLILNETSIRDFKFIISVTKEELDFQSKYDTYIEYIDKVSIQEVPFLYKQVDVLFMPTLLEIFSTSYLEAMYMEIPIIASDLSFARDVCGDAAIYCSPIDPKGYANAIIDLYSEIHLRNELINKGLINLKRFGSSMDRTELYMKILKQYSK